MAGQIQKVTRPSQSYVNAMVQRAKYVRKKQRDVLEMHGDIVENTFSKITIETRKQKRKRQSKK